MSGLDQCVTFDPDLGFARFTLTLCMRQPGVNDTSSCRSYLFNLIIVRVLYIF